MESSVFFRSLNFLRVRHPFALRYNFLYPLLLSCLTVAVLRFLAPNEAFFSSGGLITKFTPFLAVIAPFYIASLAAVSTFGGHAFIDSPFQMARPVTLLVIGKRGGWEQIDVTPRHFLSLLFGYCCIVALALFIASIFSPVLAGGISALSGGYGVAVKLSGGLVYLFFFFQMILATILGIYYLADRLHRPF